MTPFQKERRIASYYKGNDYPAEILCDLMHLEGAEALCVYEQDFYQNMPVVTKNSFGSGCAYYVGTRSNRAFYHHFLEDVFQEAGIAATMVTPDGVEASVRISGSRQILFLMNHNEGKARVVMDGDYLDLLNARRYAAGSFIEMDGRDVYVLQRQP